mgnify:CR=1 FL=1
MRPGQHNKRGRGRNRRHNGGGGGGGGGGGNPLNRVYESNGPDVKVRGTAQTVADKYLQLGRDAQVSGDIVMAESYYQHAEHYLRILAAAQAYQQQMQPQFRRPDDEFGDDDEMEAQGEGDDGQPEIGNERPGFSPDGDQPDGFDPGPERRDYQQGNRDNRDYQHNRGQDQQHHQGRDRNDRGRDRFRPRWENRRDNRDQQGGDNRYQQQGQPAYQGRREEQPQPAVEPEQPRLPIAEAVEPAPAAAPVAAPVEINGSAEKWDGPQPSFLKRPTRTRKPRAAKEAAPSED